MIFRAPAIHLFGGQTFRYQADRIWSEALGKIHDAGVAFFEKTTDEQFVDELLQELEMRVPVLDRANPIFSHEHMDVPEYPNMLDVKLVPGSSIAVRVQFEGDGAMFYWSPHNRPTGGQPKAHFDGQQITVGVFAHSYSVPDVDREIDTEFDRIQVWLDALKRDADDFNAQLRVRVTKEIARRRAHLNAVEAKIAQSRFNLKRDPSAPKTYKLPDTPKQLAVKAATQANTSKGEQEWVLQEADYQEILRIMESMSLVMERSPTVFAKAKEEHIRVHYLVQLNGQYAGAATGETFNNRGKTDILIRHNDKNVFVAECKFWKGKKELLDTANQLLGYTTWRDTKTAIVIFNRNKDFSNVIAEAQSALASHEHFKSGPIKEGESRFRYTFKHPDDAERKIIVTLLLFDMPKPKK